MIKRINDILYKRIAQIMRQKTTLFLQSHINAAGTIGSEHKQIINFLIGEMFIFIQVLDIKTAIK